MGDLKQKPIVQKKPAEIIMSIKDLNDLVGQLHGDLVKEMDALKQKVLLLEGKVNALEGGRGLEDEHGEDKVRRRNPPLRLSHSPK